MNLFRKLTPFIFILLVLASCNKNFDNATPSTKDTAVKDAPYLVVVSLDGFRWDYPDHIPTPNLDYIAQHGVKAEALIPAFPTLTFPNHYTLATGLYPDHHGVIYNRFYAPELGNQYYSYKDDEAVKNPIFYGGEPAWNTAEKQGIKSASLYWVGSEAAVEGIHPSIYKKYDHTFPFEQRLDTLASWLNFPEAKRPHLIFAYFPEPDGVGHGFGPDSDEVRDKVILMDNLMGQLLDKIKALPIGNQVNLIILADHGMCSISKDRWVPVTDKVKPEWVKQVSGSHPVISLFANEGCTDSIYNALGEFEHIKFWKPSEIPERLHLGSNPRVGDIVVAADSAWTVTYDRSKEPHAGTHGFDNANTDMHAIFYAVGPAFKENYIQPKFDNVSIYPLVSKIMKMKPAPNDGKLSEVEGMLK